MSKAVRRKRNYAAEYKRRKKLDAIMKINVLRFKANVERIMNKGSMRAGANAAS